MDIVIYSKNQCPHCVTAINAAQQIIQEPGRGSVTIHKIDEDKEAYNQLLTEVPNARSLPQVFVDGNLIGGADRFLDWIKLTNSGQKSLL
tara:strand:- start:327 stop:596 length:270 start_codon:yes stop_codon:yes gene_type:complete